MNNQILLVDDEIDILEEASEALIDEGFEVICRNNVDDAIIVLEDCRTLSAVVTDLKMPGKSGFDLVKAVYSQFGSRRPAIIVMSGHLDAGSELPEGEDLDFHFLQKPLDIEQLLESVQRAIQARDEDHRENRR